MRGNMVLPGMPASERFDIQRGGKQGGVETPEVFNAMIETLMSPLVRLWRDKGYGFKYGDYEDTLTHLVWADNIYLITRSLQEFQAMSQELTNAIYAHRFRGKASGLQILTAGPLDRTSPEPLTIMAEEPMQFKM